MGVCEGGGFSERSPSLALPPEERLAFGGVRFFWLGSACEFGAVPCELAEVTAADRAAATNQRVAPMPVNKQGPEGVAGAIGKLPDGLRPPPRLSGGEILLASFSRRRGTIRGGGWWKIRLFPAAIRNYKARAYPQSASRKGLGFNL